MLGYHVLQFSCVGKLENVCDDIEVLTQLRVNLKQGECNTIVIINRS